MPQFVRLTQWDGVSIWINPDHVIGVLPRPHYEPGTGTAEMRTQIIFDLGHSTHLTLTEDYRGTPEQNVALLMAPPAPPTLAEIGRALAREKQRITAVDGDPDAN